MPLRLERRGTPTPKPLRSEKHPHGLPNVEHADLLRVQTANAVYKNICAIIDKVACQASITIENPTRSFMWMTRWLKRLIKKHNLFPVTFQQCMHGGNDKWSTFYTNEIQFMPLPFAVISHTVMHLGLCARRSLAGFPTTDEAEYPEPLCVNIADIITKVAAGKGLIVSTVPSSAQPPHVINKLRAAEAGKQPRGSLLPQLIPEFKEIHTIEVPPDVPAAMLASGPISDTLASKSHVVPKFRHFQRGTTRKIQTRYRSVFGDRPMSLYRRH